MKIKLEKEDYKVIAQAIVDCPLDCTTEYVEINGIEFEVIFSKYTDGYIEDDYFNGTGAWVTTMAEVTIENISAGDINVEYNRHEIERITEEILKEI